VDFTALKVIHEKDKETGEYKVSEFVSARDLELNLSHFQNMRSKSSRYQDIKKAFRAVS